MTAIAANSVPGLVVQAAQWMAEHPDITVFDINIGPANYDTGPISIHVYGLGSIDYVRELTVRLGGEWVEDKSVPGLFQLDQEVAPRVVVSLACSVKIAEDA